MTNEGSKSSSLHDTHQNNVFSQSENNLTVSTAPFSLATDDDDDLDNDMSLSSIGGMVPAAAADVVVTCSTSSLDGIKVHGKGGGPPSNCLEWFSRNVGSILQTRTYKRVILSVILLCSIFLGIRAAPHPGDYS